MSGPPPKSWAVDPDEAGARLVQDGLWRLRIPVGREEFDHVNAYAIEHSGGILLIDCGTAGDPSCAVALERALADAGLRLEEVTDLLITHVHSDHVGLAAALRKRLPITIWAHPYDDHTYSALADPQGTYESRVRVAHRAGLPESRIPAIATVREELEGISGIARPDRAPVEGVEIESALGPWRVIETPGHAPSHVCLLQPDQGVAIVGDVLCAAYIIWIEYGWTPDPAAEQRSSYGRVAAAGPPALALPGHGRPLDSVEELVASHEAEFGRRLGATRDALARGPATAYEVADRAFGADSASDIKAFEHIGETMCFLRHLTREGEATQEETDDGRRVYRLAVAQ
ncbi:MAG: MBL fold metallo-hydrolase [Solirubrobacterales bacterium]